MSDYANHDTLAPADALAAYLRTVAGIGPETGYKGIPVIVGRQKDLTSEIDLAVAKATGAAILIAFQDWDDLGSESSHVHLDLNHNISIWTTPVLRTGAVPESQILGLLIAALHRYTPDAEEPGVYWRTGSGMYVKHPKHRVYSFPATIEVVLPAVTLIDP